MWQIIEDAISKEIGATFTLQNKRIINGGDISLAFEISDNDVSFFVKINDKSFFNNFEAEAFNLNHLAQYSQPLCPKVITLGTTIDKSFLVLSYFDFTSAKNSSNSWLTFGEQLAYLHKNSTHGQFGWTHDNFIGHTIQPNKWKSNWRSFFCEQRIAWQLQLLSEQSIRIGDIDHIVNICHELLSHHKVQPCLVHGDLWQGNINFVDDMSVIFDPACYYGDREVDLAMTELFGDFPANFYQGYNNIYPLPAGFEKRKHIYNFYHVLNHANLFKGIFIEQARAMFTRIATMYEIA
jgi:fructosamine-3-kinase